MSRLSIPIKPVPPPLRIGELQDAQFLLFVGHKVREARSRRGMTRKMLAREAEVSERHLAQLELGEGKVSIVLLRRITTALNIPIPEVFTADKPNAEAEDVLRRVLERVPGAQLETVVSRLRREFGENDLARRGRIALIGLRGAGKSTLGSKLAEDLEIPFVELDQEIEKDAGMDLGEIFSVYGQAGYPRHGTKTLNRVLR